MEPNSVFGNGEQQQWQMSESTFRIRSHIHTFIRYLIWSENHSVLHTVHSILVRTSELWTHSPKIKYRKHNMLPLPPQTSRSVIRLPTQRWWWWWWWLDGKCDCFHGHVTHVDTWRYTVILAKTQSHLHSLTAFIYICVYPLAFMTFYFDIIGYIYFFIHPYVLYFSCTVCSIVLWLNCVDAHCGFERGEQCIPLFFVLLLLVLFDVVNTLLSGCASAVLTFEGR